MNPVFFAGCYIIPTTQFPKGWNLHKKGRQASEVKSPNEIAYSSEPRVDQTRANEKSRDAHQIIENVVRENVSFKTSDVEQKAVVDDSPDKLVQHQDDRHFADKRTGDEIFDVFLILLSFLRRSLVILFLKEYFNGRKCEISYHVLFESCKLI